MMEITKLTPTWKLRPYRPGDETSILDLCRRVFSEQSADRFSVDYWKWEFVDNSSGPARVLLADDGGKVVGHYAVVPRNWHISGLPHLGSIVVDVMTHPDYRMQGMFAKLGLQALAEAGEVGIEFSYGFPIRKEVMPGHLKIGWKHLFDIPIFAYPLKFKTVVQTYIKIPVISSLLAGGAYAAYTVGVRPWLSITHRRPASVDEVTIRELTTFDIRFDGLWQRAKCQFPVMGVRDQKYLNWRYPQSHPYYTYRVLAAECGDNLLGYVILRTSELLGLKCGIVVDLLVDPDHLGVVDHLLNRALADFRADKNLDLVAAMMSRDGPYVTALQRHGFMVTPKVFWFILHSNIPQRLPQELLVPSNWYLTWGDTDVI
jgi:GNAT superfamily N-acetyltransferase